MFRQAINITIEEGMQSDYIDNEEHWITGNLRKLLQTFSYFMIIDRYEVMMELIKRELRFQNANKQLQSPK